MNITHLLSALAIGIAFAAQPAINGTAAKILDSTVSAAALSIGITFICTLILIPFLGGVPKEGAITQLPWWVVFGGMIGVAVVAGSAAIAPVTGAALFFVCLIAGQLFGSVLIDHVGAFGMSVRPINIAKLCGVGLALMGVLLVRFG